ncbi:MAG: hypothetical protein Q9209_003139 [Squamulea sp. 1 TL-2023]
MTMISSINNKYYQAIKQAGSLIREAEDSIRTIKNIIDDQIHQLKSGIDRLVSASTGALVDLVERTLAHEVAKFTDLSATEPLATAKSTSASTMQTWTNNFKPGGKDFILNGVWSDGRIKLQMKTVPPSTVLSKSNNGSDIIPFIFTSRQTHIWHTQRGQPSSPAEQEL